MAEQPLKLAVQAHQQLNHIRGVINDRLERRDERGEVTATTALIFLLVVAAITAGGIIAGKVVANAENVPQP